MSRKLCSTRGCLTSGQDHAERIIRRIQDRGYQIRMDEFGGKITYVASNPEAGRTLVCAAEKPQEAIHDLAVVLGIVEDRARESAAYIPRCSGR